MTLVKSWFFHVFSDLPGYFFGRVFINIYCSSFLVIEFYTDVRQTDIHVYTYIYILSRKKFETYSRAYAVQYKSIFFKKSFYSGFHTKFHGLFCF